MQSRHIFEHFWTPNLTFCFGNRPTLFLAIKNKDINNIHLLQKVPSSVKCNKHNFLTGLKNRKQKQKKQDTPKKKKRFCITSTGPLRRFWKWEYKSFLDVVGIYVKQNHCVTGHWKFLLQKRCRGSSPTVPILSLSVTIFNN